MEVINPNSSRRRSLISNHINKNNVGIMTMGIAQAMAGGFVGIYISIFYTDALGIDAAAVGLLLLIMRIWDAAIDPIAGITMDNYHNKKGKFKPFIVVSNLMMPILTILMFVDFNFQGYSKIAYAYIIYFLWSLSYTFIPIIPVMASIIKKPAQRSVIASTQRIIILLVGFTATAFMPLVLYFGDGALGYSFTIALYMIPLMFISFFGTLLIKEPERKDQKIQEKVSIKDLVSLYVHNKPMRIFSAYVFISGMIMPFVYAALIYYVKYSYGAEKMVYIMPLAMGGFILGVAISAMSGSLFSRKKLLSFAYISQALVFLGLWFLETPPLLLMFCLLAIVDTTKGMTVVPESTMSMEIMDYNEYHQGKRMAGLISTIHLFLGKIQLAFAGAATGFTLAFVGFVPNAPINDELLRGLVFIGFFIPAIFALISTLLVYLYPINEKEAIKLAENL